MYRFLALAFLLLASASFAQSVELDKTHVGGYGEISLKDPDGSPAARLSIDRFVIYLDHYFSDKWAFKSETEVENVRVEGNEPGGEVALEQAYLDYHASPMLGMRVGLLVLPIGITNQTHEPNTFYSVERPLFEQDVIPTTWREIGIGAYGDLTEGLKYQLVLSEGLNPMGFGESSLHDAKQEGTGEDGGSVASHPAISGKVEVLPIAGLRLGGSFYLQSPSFSGIAHDTAAGAPAAIEKFSAPFSGFFFDARYQLGGLRLKAVAGLETIGNTNLIHEAHEMHVAKSATGGYAEIAYDIMPLLSQTAESELLPFVRYENYKFDFEPTVGSSITRTVINPGVAFKPMDNLILKLDYLFFEGGTEENDREGQLNLGAGYSF